MGGIIFYDRIIMPEEKVGEALADMAQAIQERANEKDEDNELVFQLAEQVVDQALQKYGYRE
jgi:hypothetical protein